MSEVALVTGAGRGIGREVAVQLAARGFAVVVAARDRRSADEVAEDVGGRPLVLDVADAGSIRSAQRSTVSTSS